MSNNNILGKRLRRLRTEMNWNQIELAKKLNISNTTLSQYEAGNRMPNDEMKHLLADIFDVTVDYLIGRSDTRNLTIDDEKDIAIEMERLKRKLEKEEGLMFDGKPADPETLKAVLEALEMGTKYAKAVDRQKKH